MKTVFLTDQSLIHSFIRLCDYLVVTMLHNLVVASASAVLDVLKEQTKKDVTIDNLVDVIPDDIEEQESILQVHNSCMFQSSLELVCEILSMLVGGAWVQPQDNCLFLPPFKMLCHH